TYDGGFWGHREKKTIPTDKPPDQFSQHSPYQHPFDKPSQPHQHPQLQQQYSYQNQSFLTQQNQLQHQHFHRNNIDSQSIQTPGIPPVSMQQLPMGMAPAGYNNNGAPVYVIMAPPNGMSPQLLPDMIKQLPPNPPQSSQHLVLESVSSSASLGRRWSPSPEHTKSLPQRDIYSQVSNKSLSRAKWGEKGVGVGRLWDPEVSVNIPTANGSTGSIPPTWVEQEEGMMLPGGHVPGEKKNITV
ncbi:hypothetical protein Anas_04999, partial [Armadillidium nasatum]